MVFGKGVLNVVSKKGNCGEARVEPFAAAQSEALNDRPEELRFFHCPSHSSFHQDNNIDNLIVKVHYGHG